MIGALARQYAPPALGSPDMDTVPSEPGGEPGKVCTCTRDHCVEERCPVCRNLGDNEPCPAGWALCTWAPAVWTVR